MNALQKGLQCLGAGCMASVIAWPAVAGVPAQEAEQLKTTLTPLGGERAANKDGTIPAWDGGLAKMKVDAGNGKMPPMLFADEKPVLTIDQSNVEQHAAKLSEGQKYLVKNYAGYKINVYPSHRTFWAPQFIYDKIYQNAIGTKLNGRTIEGEYKGSLPFPIPKTGLEAMFNTQFATRAPDRQFDVNVWVVSGGKRSLAVSTLSSETNPAEYPPDRKDPWAGAFKYLVTVETTAPSYQAGEKVLGMIPTQLKETPNAWTYLTGQRRLRKTPNVEYDVPSPFTSGVTNYDDQNGFQGQEDRYDWKLLGKQEMVVPYNNNNFLHASLDADKAFGPQFVNPDMLRWELHRVWVLEGTLKAGARHVVPRRKLYVDEDSWQILQSDQWDAKGRFWKAIQVTTFVTPQAPGVLLSTNAIYNTQANSYTIFNAPAKGGYSYKALPSSRFSTSALESGGVR